MTCVVIVFWPALDHDFIARDDGLNIVENPLLHPVTPATFARLWRAPFLDMYIPLTYSTWACLAVLARAVAPGARPDGLNPAVFHAANVVLHALSALVVWRIILRLNLSRRSAVVGALLFALHPLMAEPVSWATALKDTLGGFWALLAIWQYLRFNTASAGERRGMAWAFATACFFCALISKPTMVAAAPIAWLLAMWARPRPLWASIVPLLPWALPVFPLLLISFRGQTETGAANSVWSPLWTRPLVALDTIGFYARKVVVPVGLSPVYGRTPARVMVGGQGWSGWAVALALGALAWTSRRRFPWLPVGLGVFALGVLPASGLLRFEYQLVSTTADRYVYLSMLGVAIVAAGALHGRVKGPMLIACCAGLIVLGALANRQTRYWSGILPLYEHARAVVGPNEWISMVVGRHYMLGGRTDEGLQLLREAIRENPRLPYVHNHYGTALNSIGDLAGARERYEIAIGIWPAYRDAHYNLASVLVRQGDDHAALRHFAAAVQQHDKPIAREWRLDYANALARCSMYAQAVVQYDLAIDADPKYAEAYYARAMAVGLIGDELTKIEDLSRALELRSDWPESLNALAEMRASSTHPALRDPAEAVRLAGRAVALTRRRAAVPLATLASAQAASGDFAAAVAVASEAHDVATASGNHALVAELARRLDAYRAGRVPVPATTQTTRPATLPATREKTS
ncbi:MAG: tetratricopeptide repeat protein [Tepidisphaeraceae bacterium]